MKQLNAWSLLLYIVIHTRDNGDNSKLLKKYYKKLYTS